MNKLSFKEWSILSDLRIIDAIQEDYEYSMARSELKTAQSAISRLMKKLQGEGELEAWIQSKITKASDYIDTVADYIDSGESETEEEVKEELKSHKSVESIAKKHRMDPSDIQKQLEMGIKIEHEHVTDKDTATDIALQHLDEIPDYYTRLKKMEAGAKKEHKKFKDVIEDTEILDAQGNQIDSSYYKVDFQNAKLIFKNEFLSQDSLTIRYLKFPEFLTKTYSIYDENRVAGGGWIVRRADLRASS